jgi:hypothetical protein
MKQIFNQQPKLSVSNNAVISRPQLGQKGDSSFDSSAPSARRWIHCRVLYFFRSDPRLSPFVISSYSLANYANTRELGEHVFTPYPCNKAMAQPVGSDPLLAGRILCSSSFRPSYSVFSEISSLNDTPWQSPGLLWLTSRSCLTSVPQTLIGRSLKSWTFQ